MKISSLAATSGKVKSALGRLDLARCCCQRGNLHGNLHCCQLWLKTCGHTKREPAQQAETLDLSCELYCKLSFISPDTKGQAVRKVAYQFIQRLVNAHQGAVNLQRPSEHCLILMLGLSARRDGHPAGCTTCMPSHCVRGSAFMDLEVSSMKAEFLSQWRGMTLEQPAG